MLKVIVIMEKELLNGLMGINMKVIGQMVKELDKVNIFIVVAEVFIPVNGKIIIDMVKEQ